MKLGQTSVVHFSSQVVMSVAGFAANLYIARTLGPEIHGTYFLVIALIHWITIFGDLGINLSLKKRLSEGEDRKDITASAMWLRASLALVVAGGVLVSEPLVNDYVGAPVAKWLAVMAPVTLAFTFVTSVLDGQHKVHIASLLTPVNWTFRSVLQIGLVSIGLTLAGLFVGYLVGGAIAILVGLYFAKVSLGFPTRQGISDLLSFAKYSWLGSLQGLSFRSMDTILLGLFVASELIGIYEIAWNLASLFAIFGSSVSRAVFPEVSSVGRETQGRVEELTSASLAYAGLFIIPGLVGTVIVGDVVLTIYGQAYARGYSLLVILIISRLFYAYADQLLSVINAVDRPDVGFRINLVFLGTNLVLNILLISQFGWVGAAVATGISALGGLYLGYISLNRIIDVSVPYKEIGRQVVAALVMGTLVYAGRKAFGDSLSVIIALVMVGAVVYFATLYGISPQFRKTIKDNLPARVRLA